MTIERSKCPCCGSDNDKFLYKLGYGNVHKCAECKTAYTVFNGLDIKKSNETFNTADFVKARLYDQYELRKIARNRLSLLGKFIKGGDILEFGSSTGEFLYEAAKKKYKVSCVDLHPVVLNMNKIGGPLEIIKSDASFFTAKRTYDAIVAFHVIEHLTDPGEFLLNCGKALKPHGVIFLEVPNFCSISRKIWGRRSGMFYDYHVCHFDKGSLEFLIRRYGYEVLDIRSIDDPGRYIAPIYNPFRHGLWSLIKKLQRRKGSAVCDSMPNNAPAGYSAEDEIRIFNSNKARIYRLEAGFIRAISKALLPLCMLLNNCYSGSGLQIIVRKR